MISIQASLRHPAMIEFHGVNKYYGSHHVLVDVTETIARGEVLVICGPSGSGKSTLIRTINRLEAIDSGRVTFDGEDIHAPHVKLDRLLISVNPYKHRHPTLANRSCRLMPLG